MRFMIIVKSCPEFEAATRPDADTEVLAAMARFHEQLAQAGVLLDATGLKPSRTGWRVHYGPDSGPSGRCVVDGPFTEAKELIAGYTLIQVRSREEAMEWSRRYPNPVREGAQAVIEVRELFELDDFEPSPAVEAFRQLPADAQARRAN